MRLGRLVLGHGSERESLAGDQVVFDDCDVVVSGAAQFEFLPLLVQDRALQLYSFLEVPDTRMKREQVADALIDFEDDLVTDLSLFEVDLSDLIKRLIVELSTQL